MRRSTETHQRLKKLEQLAELKASAERTRLATRLRDEARIAQQVAALKTQRETAAERLAHALEIDVAFTASTMGWLRASQEEMRRLNIQLAALRARTETARAQASRAAARQSVLQELLRRTKPKHR